MIAPQIREGFLEALLFACELARAIAGVEVLHSTGNVSAPIGIHSADEP